MILSAVNFLTHIKNLVTGGGRRSDGSARHDAGFMKEVPYPLGAIDSGSSIAAYETHDRVLFVEETVDVVGYIHFTVPRDYDEATDILTLRFLANMLTVSTDDDVELDVEVYVRPRATNTLSADKDPTSPGLVLSIVEQWHEFDLKGYGLRHEDVVTIEIITNGGNDTNGEEVQLHAASLAYRSCLVSYVSGVDDAGNPLR